MEKRDKRKHPFTLRVSILFLLIFFLFTILIFRLGVVQILNGDSFQAEIDRTTQDTTKMPVPRGRIYDRYHRVIVDNQPLYAITYMPAKGVQAQERLEVAEKLSTFISMYHGKNKQAQLDTLTLRDKKEYWYLKHIDEAKKRLMEKEVASMDPSEQYSTILKRINKEEVNDITEEQLNIILIKKELDKAMTLTPHIVKNEGVTPSEFAKVSEHLHELPGINATTDWKRAYPYGDTIKKLLGSITSHKEGILKDKKDFYLTRGYSPNDRVGKSGLEEQYEAVLRGRKEQMKYTINKRGEIVDSNIVVEGQQGKDLVLTIDIALQEKVDQIVRDELKAIIKKYPYENRHMEDALAVVLNPKTGELLAVSGQHYDRKQNAFRNTAYKALYDQHIPGSAVKGATVLAGYQSAVIAPGDTFYDKPLKIKGTPEKSSYTDSSLGLLNDQDALKRSSNVYMFYIALRMGGEYHYQYNQPVTFQKEAFQEMRNYFSQFGLGVQTGVDYPYEGTGYKGPNPVAGNLLDFAIGQYDTYTTMQLAQYVSTIANDGLRVRPHFLKEIRLPNPSEKQLGSLFKSVNTDVLNRVEMSQSQIKRVQEGFRRVYQEPGGTAYREFGDKSYNPAGKTGTAENEINGNYTENLTLIGYAPFDHPEVAFAIVVPHTGKGEHVNNKIGERIMDAYFELKEERREPKDKEQTE
ncbi:penicillin-binding protein 2 [Agaribacter marinus]|uniref:serine-type D-Ala-D-Ala carboxypeptidase n=1 Tax=Virgibacillus salarius TaxID=447199 RepID=A0A941DQP9_9BACI|nr:MULTISPECIES: penicillin-binding protein 2 [Bacillaceae]MBR7794785.1 penicillin-binding protein 2 [Virgibacillus salarius]MDY7046271.1 penicillin-binding protein 2 [Virgibacillus sp. M23]NAZ07505.1 penicillin-binding protein 2 [Agaribacter marinus]